MNRAPHLTRLKLMKGERPPGPPPGCPPLIKFITEDNGLNPMLDIILYQILSYHILSYIIISYHIFIHDTLSATSVNENLRYIYI